MNKSFYVYKMESESDERRLAFIEEDRIKDFTFNVFVPDKFEFTDICVKAPDVETAQKVYANPVEAPEGCEYVMSEEHKLPAAKRFLAEQHQTKQKSLRKNAHAILISHARSLQHAVSDVAKMLYEDSNKILTEEQVYRLLMNNFTETVVKLPYVRKPGDDGHSEAGSPV